MPAARRSGLLLTSALGLFIGLCNTSHAADFVRHNEGVGIKLGLTASDVRGHAVPHPYELTIGAGPSDPLWGITGGFFWSYAIARRLSIQTDLQFTQGGVDGGLYLGTPLPDATARLRYLELAVLPKVHVRESNRQRFSVYAGMTLGIQTAKEPSAVYWPSEPFQYGVGIGVMWDYDSDRLTTLLDLRYTTSFNELQPNLESRVKNEALTLSVGVSPGSRRARGRRAVEHAQLDWTQAHVPADRQLGWILAHAADRRIRVDLNAGSRIEGLFVRYQPDTLTLSHQQRLLVQPDTLTPSDQRPGLRRSHSRWRAKLHSVSVASVDEREVGIAMEGVNRLFVRKREGKKGLLIGGALGAALGALVGFAGEDSGAFINPGPFLAVPYFVIGAVVGGVIGRVEHWAAVYP